MEKEKTTFWEILLGGIKKCAEESTWVLFLTFLLWLFPHLRPMFTEYKVPQEEEATLQSETQTHQQKEIRLEDELKPPVENELTTYGEVLKEEETQRSRESTNAEVLYDLGRKNDEAGNYQEAENWYRKAAEQGHAEAQYHMGNICESAYDFTGRNYDKAFEWYLKAAEQGHIGAQYELGNMYCLGGTWRNFSLNFSEAAKWYRKAAEQGHADAQYSLGSLYQNGEGVEQDYLEAMKWYIKAAAQGHVSAEKRRQEVFELLAAEGRTLEALELVLVKDM